MILLLVADGVVRLLLAARTGSTTELVTGFLPIVCAAFLAACKGILGERYPRKPVAIAGVALTVLPWLVTGLTHWTFLRIGY